MFKTVLLIFIVLFFSACGSSAIYNYNQSNNEIKLKVANKSYLTQKLDNEKFNSTFDTCTNESYLLQTSDYFIEHISLNSNCHWNGLASGYFESLFKEKLKLKSMIALERIDINNYTFSTLKINDSHRLNIISLYTVFSDTFIIDYKGELYEELLTKLNPSYIDNYKHLPRFQTNYHHSLVKNNFINSYFNQEVEYIRD